MALNTSLPTLKPPESDRSAAMDLDVVIDYTSIILYSFIIVVGTTGNFMVIWVAGFKLKPKVTHVWLVNLAIADLIFSLTGIFSLARKLSLDNWHFGVLLCKFIGFFKYGNMYCSVFLLAVISLDRALCIWQPIFARRHRTLRAARVVAVCVWGAATAFSSPYFAYHLIHKKNNVTKCALEESDGGGAKTSLYVIRFLCGFLLPSVVILICYVLAGIGIRRTRLVGKARPLRIVALLVVAFFLCWAPYHCLLLVHMVHSKSKMVKIWLRMARGMAYLHSCMNPLLYFCMGIQGRGQLRQSLVKVYSRALADDIDGQITQCNERFVDDNSATKHTSVV